MIIVSNKNIENSIYFPQNIYTNNTGVYTLILRNRGTNRTYTFDNLDNKHLASYGFYSFFLDFSNLDADEYEYTLKDSNNDVVSTGLIRLNELEQNNKYYGQNIDYKVYGER